MKITIINSRGHWRNGWMSSPADLQLVTKVLEDAKIEVRVAEVESVPQLTELLDTLTPDTLVWSNAYFVNDAPNPPVWLNDHIEERGLALLGSGARALRDVLDKDICQAHLARAGFPVPRFAVFTTEHDALLEERLEACGVGFPMVLKPTREAGSVGVSLAHDAGVAAVLGRRILSDFPEGKLIVEQFLPSDDITCGFVQLGTDVMLMPTAYIVRSAPGRTNILSRDQRLRTWDEHDKIAPVVTDESIIAQLREHIPALAASLDLRGVTRVDGRLDTSGTLRFFDVNGLPALSYPDSVMVKQCISCFPEHPPESVFRALVSTLIHHAALHYDLEVPQALDGHHLFSLTGGAVHRLSV